MITLRLVELEGNKFAVQERKSWRRWEYCSLREHYIWGSSIPRQTWEYCIANSLEAAETALEKVIMDINNKRKKLPRVIKVIRTVKV